VAATGVAKGRKLVLPTNKKKAPAATKTKTVAAAKKPAAKHKPPAAASKGKKKEAPAAASSLKSPPAASVKKKQEAASSDSSKRKKDPNFDPLEDSLLCYSWLNKSMDPVLGANQEGRVFWAAVHQGFITLRDSCKEELDEHVRDTERDTKAITYRFQKYIAKDARHFLRFWRKYYFNKPSGVPEEEYIKKAMEDWKAEKGRPYQFKKCSEILRQSSTFDPLKEPSPVPSDQLIDVDDAAAVTAVPVPNQTATVQGASAPRPTSQKKAKEIQKTKVD
jgi:hypothetical protein